MNIKPLSYTQISLYRACPLNYKLQYIDHLPTAERWYFSFGTSLHACVERFFKVKTPHPPAYEELMQFYEASWQSAGYASPEEEARYKEYGREILGKFYDLHIPNFRLPIATERPFVLDVDGVKVRGFIDRIDKLDSGGLAIVDYKTSQELFTAEHVANDLQLTIYQMAAEQTWNLPVEKLTLYHLRTNTPCTSPPRPAAVIGDTRRLVLDVAENIAAGNFPAREHQFCPCDFPQYCPYHRHRFAKEAAAPQQEQLPGIKAADAVDRYAALQAQIKDLETQLAAVRESLIQYCDSSGVCRVFGTEQAIDYKMVERRDYAAEDVRGVLEPAGLWEKVLGFDKDLLKQLLADKTLPPELKKRLDAIRKVTSAYPMLKLKEREEEPPEEK